MNKSPEPSATAAPPTRSKCADLRVRRGKNRGLRRARARHPARSDHGAAGPVRLRQDHADALDRRRAEDRRRHRHRARRPRRHAAQRRRVAYDTQAASVYGDLTVSQNLALLRPAHRRAAQRRRPRDRRRSGLTDHAEQTIASLSGGAGEPRLARGRDARLAASCWCSTSRRSGLDPRAAHRAVGTVPRARRPRRDAHRQQPRHGRGAALRPAHAHARGSHHRRHDTRRPPRRHGRRRSGCRVPHPHRTGCRPATPSAARGVRDAQHPLTRT